MAAGAQSAPMLLRRPSSMTTGSSTLQISSSSSSPCRWANASALPGDYWVRMHMWDAPSVGSDESRLLKQGLITKNTTLLYCPAAPVSSGSTRGVWSGRNELGHRTKDSCEGRFALCPTAFLFKVPVVQATSSSVATLGNPAMNQNFFF